MKLIKNKKIGHSLKINRRVFLYTSISLALSGSVALLDSSRTVPLISTEEKLLSILNDKSSAIIIGKAILNKPNNLEETNLINLILDLFDLSYASINTISKSDLATRFCFQVQNDFDKDNIVSVLGWRLGLTETLLCVLAAKTYEG